jgi:hypothetical protein
MTTDLENEEVRGKTSEAPVSEGDLAALKTLVDEIRTDLSALVQSRRDLARDTRMCRWDGQSDDGRKHREDLGQDAVPYENASDARVRIADKIVNERVAELVLATRRGSTRVVGMDGLDEGKAGRLEILRQWVLNQWGDDFRRQTELLAQFQEGGAPGIGVALVDWDWEWGLESKTVTRDDVLASWAEGRGQEAGGRGQESGRARRNRDQSPVGRDSVEPSNPLRRGSQRRKSGAAAPQSKTLARRIGPAGMEVAPAYGVRELAPAIAAVCRGVRRID